MGAVYLCRAGAKEFIAASFLGESAGCYFVTPELADPAAVRASADQPTTDPRNGRAWAGEWVAIPHEDATGFAFTRR